MEIIKTLGCILVFIEIVQWFIINRALRCIKSIQHSIIKLALHHNISVLDISVYMKEDLQKKAKIRELTPDEKKIFDKCHETICKIENNLKDSGFTTDVLH